MAKRLTSKQVEEIYEIKDLQNYIMVRIKDGWLVREVKKDDHGDLYKRTETWKLVG